MLDRFLTWFEQHKFGIIGTLLVHTVVLFSLAIVQVRTTPDEKDRSDMRVDMPDAEEVARMLEEIDLATLGATAPVSNLVSNENADPARNAAASAMDAAQMQRLSDRVERSLRELEQEEFDRLAEERRAAGEEVTVPELDPSKWDQRQYMKDAPPPVKVEGPTTVTYDLKGRYHEYIYIPAYLCPGHGRVVVQLTVDRTGRVKRAELDRTASRADDCMMEYAVEAASRARFDRNEKAPAEQRGSITYTFLPQK